MICFRPAGKFRRGERKKRSKGRRADWRMSEQLDPEDALPMKERLMIQYEDDNALKKNLKLEQELKAMYTRESKIRKTMMKNMPGIRSRSSSILSIKEQQKVKEVLSSRRSKEKRRQDSFEGSLSPELRKRPTMSPSKKVKKQKTSIYVKRDSDKVFTPIHLEDKTIQELFGLLKAKFGDTFDEVKVGNVYQKNKKGFCVPSG